MPIDTRTRVRLTFRVNCDAYLEKRLEPGGSHEAAMRELLQQYVEAVDVDGGGLYPDDVEFEDFMAEPHGIEILHTTQDPENENCGTRRCEFVPNDEFMTLWGDVEDNFLGVDEDENDAREVHPDQGVLI